MADTLTQEQIDAMLSSVLSGGDTASLDTHEEKEEIKEYDFRTPKKFTKEQIKILERIFENYSRHLSSRDFTEIEINVMRGIVERFTSLMSQAWDGYVDTNPKLESIETNSRVISAADADETMIIVAMEVTVNDSKSIVSFCMSAITMDQIMKKFSAKFSSGKRAGSPTKETERKENLMSTLSQSELTVTAVLDDTMLTLRDVLNLQVNDIIPLNKPITDNVQLKVGSTCWFDGKLGTLNGKKAFRIDNILKN